MNNAGPTVLFAGGGTGGHIFPNLAVVERLLQSGRPFQPHFLVSARTIDAAILNAQGVNFTALEARPLNPRPWTWPGFIQAYHRGKRQVDQLLTGGNVAALVATGGFVSGPAMAAAARAGIPTALVNLDAVPGKANRRIAGMADRLFTTYPAPEWPAAARIGMPLRRIAISDGNRPEARRRLGLEESRPTLFICGGSQGAQTLNDLMITICSDRAWTAVLADWQLLHLTGAADEQRARDAYQQAGLRARVLAFCDHMGDAWGSAEAAISRAGASSVAEAWANAVPTVFLPYPFHRDQHQRLNAQPMVEVGGALLMDDQVDAALNAGRLRAMLLPLLEDSARRASMVQRLREHHQEDGAMAVAQWILNLPASTPR